MLDKLREILGGGAPQVRQPIFVVGCGRSGTTLLFDLLSTHPSLARTAGYPDGEDHDGWIKHGQCVLAGVGNVHHSRYGDGINGQHYCLHMTAEDVTEGIVRGMHDYYWNEVLARDRGKRAINKQPHLSNKLGYLLGIFPDAKIVHIVRACEPMVASWLAVMDEHPTLVTYWPKDEPLPCLWFMKRPQDPVALARLARHPQFFPGGGSEIWIDYWCKVNPGIETQMLGREDQLLTVRYEDLVSAPDKVLGKIVSFCELPSFAFEVGRVQKNTAMKHVARMTPELKEAIAVQSRQFRGRFGYEGGTAGDLARCLYLP